MTTIALVGPVPPFRSGIADQTARLARAIARLGHEPFVITYCRLYPRFLYPGEAERSGGAAPADLPRVVELLDWARPSTFREAARLVGEAGAPLVLVPWWTSFLAPHTLRLLDALARLPKPPTRLLLCHNLADHGAGALSRLLARRVLSRADRLAVQNRASEALVRARFPEKPAAFIPHPSEPREVLPDREKARAALGIPREAPLFLFTGLLRPYKGWKVLLEAWPRVVEAFPGALLVLAGEAWGEAKALAAAPAPRGVRLELRFLPEKERDQWLAACDAVVCPYLSATGSGIAADALAHGRPLVGTRVDGLVDVIVEGHSGLLVPPNDAAALTAALRRFLAEGLGPRLSAGAAHERTRFTPEAHARRVLELGGLAAPAG